ncbi:MAG: hypothetical protein IMW89_13885 [Ktedonobacteraceae bacterium]|nr:hypothetical protein [Ktedonobacteraceae bacterium]
MSTLQKSLFAPERPRAFGVGYHNVGSGVLRASDEAMIKKIERHYGERCGHLPLDASRIGVLVEYPTPDICEQIGYLGQLFGKDIAPITFDDFKRQTQQISGNPPLIVPYINVPETEMRIRQDLGAETWGLPGQLTVMLKNKASFYQLVDELGLEGFALPDYTIAHVYDVASTTQQFLYRVEELYHRAGMPDYPLGVMLRAAESDGNYGCCLLQEQQGTVMVLPDGEAGHSGYYSTWQEALLVAQRQLAATMNLQKETRIVISRFVELVDSPGMSVVIMDGHVESLGWNGQLQHQGSKACIGTSTYSTNHPHLLNMRPHYEERTADYFEQLLRLAAGRCGLDFTTLHGIANLDIMIPGEMEQALQAHRKQPPLHYLAECNPRWTNYTDAIMTVIGASRRAPTIRNMRAVIQEGISTFDKYPLPAYVDPRIVRERIFERDAVLRQSGMRIICRMAKNPMGVIFAGDTCQASKEFDLIISSLAD